VTIQSLIDPNVTIQETPEEFLPTEEQIARAHELRQLVQTAGEGIDDLFEQGMRALFEFVRDPALRITAGWDSVEEMWEDPDVRKITRVAIGSYEQRRRVTRLMYVDHVLPDLSLFRQARLSGVTQTPKLNALESVAQAAEVGKISREEAVARGEEILESEVSPAVKTVGARQYSVLHSKVRFDGRPVVEFTDTAAGVRLASLLLHLPKINWRIEGRNVVAYIEDERFIAGHLLISPEEEDDDFAEIMTTLRAKLREV
jgi:hypothetical protein